MKSSNACRLMKTVPNTLREVNNLSALASVKTILGVLQQFCCGCTILTCFRRESQRPDRVTVLRPTEPCFIIEGFCMLSRAIRGPAGAKKRLRGWCFGEV